MLCQSSDTDSKLSQTNAPNNLTPKQIEFKMNIKALSITLLMVLISGSVFSQNRQRQNRATPPPIEERVETTLEKLTSELSLSKEQQESSIKIFTDFYSSIDKLRASGNRPDRSKIDSFSKQRDEAFSDILTEDQKKKYNKLKDELFSRRRRPNQ